MGNIARARELYQKAWRKGDRFGQFQLCSMEFDLNEDIGTRMYWDSLKQNRPSEKYDPLSVIFLAYLSSCQSGLIYKVFSSFLMQIRIDPNTCFSGIAFFSGLTVWSLQIEKRSLMGSFFFWC